MARHAAATASLRRCTAATLDDAATAVRDWSALTTVTSLLAVISVARIDAEATSGASVELAPTTRCAVAATCPDLEPVPRGRDFWVA